MTDDYATTLPQSQPAPALEFIDLARLGKNEWWRYLLGIIGIVVLFYVLLVLLIVIMLPAVIQLVTGAATANEQPTPFLSYVELNLSFIALLIALAVVVVGLHRRPFRTLITPFPRVNWTRIWIGFGLWFVLAGVVGVIEHLLYPGRYELGANVGRMLLPSLLVIVLTPIQTTTEELLFRGYILQWLALRTRNPLILAVVSGFIFMVVHLANPEVSAGFVLVALYYWGFGVLLALITIRSQGLEFAIGIHAANNLFTALIANPAVSALTTDSVFVVKQLDPVYGLITFGLGAVAIYAVIVRFVVNRSASTASA